MAPLERSVIGPARAQLLGRASGRVLEVGAGSGANLAWYPPTVSSLDLCEADPFLRRRLERRVSSRPWPFRVAVHPAATQGPFPSADYDTVVSTFVMCSVGDPEATASAIVEVLAPGGRVVYLEHVHAGGLTGRLQSALSPLWRRVGGSCRLDRPATAALRSAGLVPVEQRWLRLLPPLSLAISGEAIIRVRQGTTHPPSPGPSPATVPL